MEVPINIRIIIMGTLHEDIFTCTIHRGILDGMRKISVQFFVDYQNTYFRYKHFSEIIYFT
jgi:hypothetical protein